MALFPGTATPLTGTVTLLGDQATVPVTEMTAHGEFIIYVPWYSYLGNKCDIQKKRLHNIIAINFAKFVCISTLYAYILGNTPVNVYNLQILLYDM